MMQVKKICWAMLIAILGCVQLWAQADRGTITGTVTDTSGKVVVGVQVVATNTATGVAFRGTTNELGIYSILNLPIGSYTARFTRDGFAVLNRTNLSLIAAQVLEINATLQVGSTQETVTVSSAPPLIETETSSLGTTLESRALTDLPLNVSGGRDASVILYSTTPTMTGGYYQDHIGGSPEFSKTVLIDGTDGNNGMQGFVFAPGMDALQEVQAQVSGIGVEGAGTGGGVLMYEIKSGTNQFHGSAFEFGHNEFFDANTWSNNYFGAQCIEGDTACRQTYKRGRNRLNDFGFSAGGPIWKNHTFIFGDVERYIADDLRQNPIGATAPTAKMLTGDFSELLTMGANTGEVPDTIWGGSWMNPCTNQPYLYGQIFDTATWQTATGFYASPDSHCSMPFEGNVIPSSRFSSVSQKLIAAYQKYYAPTVTTRLMNNYPSMLSSAPWWRRTAVDLKLDHYFSEKQHVSVSFDYLSIPVRNASGLFNLKAGGGPLSGAWDQKQIDRTARFIYSYAITPRLLNAASVSMAQNFIHEKPDTPVNPADFGFNNEDSTNFPVISFAESNGYSLTGTGTATQDYYALNGFHFEDKLLWAKGRHSFRFGGEFTALQNNSNYGGNVQRYAFTNTTGATDNYYNSWITPWIGSGFANMLLGDVQSASQAVENPSYDRRKLFDMFVGDDIKVTPRLTINAGVRWDVTLPMHEKYGRWTNWDMTATNPLWGGFKGAWTFAEHGDVSFEKDNNFHQFGPHVGAAYQVTNRLVARGAWGLFYIPIGMNQWYGQSNPGDQNYFFTGTNAVTNNILGAVAFNWDGGYPGTTQYLPRTSTQTYVNGIWPISIEPNELHLGKTQNWNAGVEYELSKNMLMILTYTGNIGRDLHDGNLKSYLNYPSWSTWSTLYNSGNAWAYVSDASSAAAAGVPYPFDGFAGYAWTAIGPVPQVAQYWGLVAFAGSPIGSSAYNAFIAEVKSRHSHGLTMDLSYTLSKATGNVAGDTNFWNAGATYYYQTMDDFKATGNVLSYDMRHTFKGYVTYDLPFGKNQMWGSGLGAWDRLIGGWTLGFQPTYASGQPLSAVGSTITYPGWMGLRADLVAGKKLGNSFKKLNLNNLSDTSNQFFDPTAFANPANGSLGNSPFIYNNWRGWASLNENLSILKHFNFGESGRYSASIRCEFYDVFNRHQYSSPDENMSSPYFGQVTGVSGNRTAQYGARFQW